MLLLYHNFTFNFFKVCMDLKEMANCYCAFKATRDFRGKEINVNDNVLSTVFMIQADIKFCEVFFSSYV